MDWISFFLGVGALLFVELIALVWAAVVMYKKQQAAKAEVADAVTEAMKNFGVGISVDAVSSSASASGSTSKAKK